MRRLSRSELQTSLSVSGLKSGNSNSPRVRCPSGEIFGVGILSTASMCLYSGSFGKLIDKGFVSVLWIILFIRLVGRLEVAQSILRGKKVF